MSQRGSGPSPEPVDPDRVIAIGRATLRHVDFRKARFDHFSLTGCLFLDCDFRGVRLDRRWQSLFSAQPASTFRDCRFDGADLRRVRPDLARFEGCTFDDALLDGWRTEAAQFVACRFAGRMVDVRFYGEPTGGAARRVDHRRTRNDFRGNDFRDADFDDVLFFGIDLGSQRLPASDRYVRVDRFSARLARAHAAVRRWDAPEERTAGLAMLRALATRWRGQDDVIEVRLRSTGAPKRVQIRVWDVLEHAI